MPWGRQIHICRVCGKESEGFPIHPKCRRKMKKDSARATIKKEVDGLKDKVIKLKEGTLDDSGSKAVEKPKSRKKKKKKKSPPKKGKKKTPKKKKSSKKRGRKKKTP